MSAGARRLPRRLWIVFFGLWLVFTGLTFAATWSLLSRPGIPARIDADWLGHVVATTLATLAGPMTGAVARGFRSGCLGFSLRALAVVAPVLFVGVGLAIAPLPERPAWSWVRGAAWSLGWFVWFASGIVSLGHALE